MKIIWHQKAVDDFYLILQYCLKSFGKNTANKVRTKILSDIQLLADHPNLGRKEDWLDGITTLEYRSLVINQTKVIYSVHPSHIYIHILWNTYKDPNNINEELNRRTPPTA